MGSTARWRGVYGGEYAPTGLRLFVWWKKNGERKLQKADSDFAQIRSYLNRRHPCTFISSRYDILAKQVRLCRSTTLVPWRELHVRAATIIDQINWSHEHEHGTCLALLPAPCAASPCRPMPRTWACQRQLLAAPIVPIERASESWRPHSFFFSFFFLFIYFC
jgi:hypothetical protein